MAVPVREAKEAELRIVDLRARDIAAAISGYDAISLQIVGSSRNALSHPPITRKDLPIENCDTEHGRATAILSDLFARVGASRQLRCRCGDESC